MATNSIRDPLREPIERALDRLSDRVQGDAAAIADLALLETAIREREAALRFLQWNKPCGGSHCRYCGRFEDEGHNAVCTVAALLAPAPEKES